MMAAVLPVFFSNYIASDLEGAKASSYWGYANTLSMLLIAISAPFLGAIQIWDLNFLDSMFIEYKMIYPFTKALII